MGASRGDDAVAQAIQTKNVQMAEFCIGGERCGHIRRRHLGQSSGDNDQVIGNGLVTQATSGKTIIDSATAKTARSHLP